MTHPFRKLSSWLKMGFKTPQLQVLAWGDCQIWKCFPNFWGWDCFAFWYGHKIRLQRLLLAQLLLRCTQTLRDGFFLLLLTWRLHLMWLQKFIVSSDLLTDLPDAGNKCSSPTGTRVLHSRLTGCRESKARGINRWGQKKRKAKSFLKLNKSSQRIMQLVFQSWENVWRK